MLNSAAHFKRSVQILLGALVSTSVLQACQGQAPLLRNQLPAPLQRQSVTAFQSTPTAEAQIFEQPVPVAVLPDRLIFEGSHSFAPGQVLMGRSVNSQDFLRRIEQVQPSGSQTMVLTTPATLFDAFEELSVKGAQAERLERISLRQQRFNIGGVLDIVVDVGVKPDFSDTQISLKNKRLNVKMAPTFELDAQVRSEYRFLNAGNHLNPKPVGKVDFTAATFPAWAGPVPLVFHLKPGAALDFAHQAQGTLSVGTQLEGQLKVQLEMEAALGEAPSTRSDSSYQFNGSMLPPELRLKGAARARLHLPQIHLDTEIAGLVGPFVEAGPYVDATYQRKLTATPTGGTAQESVRAQLGLAVFGGITPTRLFGKDLSREIRIKILDRQIKELYRKDTTVPVTAAEAEEMAAALN